MVCTDMGAMSSDDVQASYYQGPGMNGTGIMLVALDSTFREPAQHEHPGMLSFELSTTSPGRAVRSCCV